MAISEVREEPCGCTEDFCCPGAEALWADVNAAYRRAIRTPDTDETEYDAAWERYDDALLYYRAHRSAAGMVSCTG